MTTTNPRITVTLQPQVYAVMKRLSVLTRNSQSALIGELLAESLPIFERMVEVLEAAEKLRSQGMAAGAEITGALETAQARLEAQMGLAFETMETGNRPLLDAAEKVQRRGGSANAAERSEPALAAPTRRRVAPTPLSNRGVTPLRKVKKAASAKGGR